MKANYPKSEISHWSKHRMVKYIIALQETGANEQAVHGQRLESGREMMFHAEIWKEKVDARDLENWKARHR